MRLIDADYLLHKAGETFNTKIATLGEEAILWRFQSLIENAPTETCEKHGHWIELYAPEWAVKRNGTKPYRCSNCGEQMEGVVLYRYCPFCGAQMELPIIRGADGGAE